MSKSKKTKLKNHVLFVLDESGSMAWLKNDVLKVFNKWVQHNREESKKNNQDTSISLVKFNSITNLHYFNADISRLNDLTSSDYYPNGGTALFDGLMLGINNLDNLKDKDASYLVIVITDGHENSSEQRNINAAPNAIKTRQNEGNWSFVFLLPPGNAKSFINSYNLLDDNVREWENTKEGLREAEERTSAGLSHYYSSRAAGQRSVKQFFTTDLSKVKQKDLKQNLFDVTKNCTIITAAKEEAIKPLVERRVGTYKVGCAYYQLMKPEKVHSHKEVLIMDKASLKIWSGTDARQMIGIPEGQDARVNPGNHMNYEIFCQSTSVNRKIPRGTKVVVVK